MPPSLGGWICTWIEENLVHAEGDYYGQPFRLLPFQRDIIWRAYELNADGSRKWNQVVLGLGKGNGKTELVAAIADAELGGPVIFDGWDGKFPKATMRLSPDIPVAAASFEQADILYSAAKTMLTAGRLKPFFDCYDTEILLKQGPGRLYRVAAAAGTNDGKRPTFFAADELHEWVGNKERVHLVLSNGRAKRADAWEFNISTAGWDPNSLLGRKYNAGKRGRGNTLFIWYEAGEKWDISKKRELRKAIREANPAAGHFLDVEAVAARYEVEGMPEHEFRRYHLNQWVENPQQWMPVEVWGPQGRSRQVPKGSKITLGFDGAYNRDSTALVGCTEDSHLFVVGAWERPAGIQDWHVSKEEVMAVIEESLGRWEVAALGFDDTFGRIWGADMEALEAKGVPVVAWPTRSQARMAPACGAFYGAVKDGTITHEDDARLNRHIANCVTKGTRYGPVIVKEHKDSERRIDLAVASVIAYDMATRSGPKESVYEERGVLVL